MVGILSRLLMIISQYNKTILQEDACHVYRKLTLKCQSRDKASLRIVVVDPPEDVYFSLADDEGNLVSVTRSTG